MADNISFIETDDITNKVQIILRQTNLSEEVAREKLKEANFDHISVIKSFLGIAEKKAPPIKSKNQEIYGRKSQCDYDTDLCSADLLRIVEALSKSKARLLTTKRCLHTD